jgi:cell volume regulation protein A
MHDLESFFLTLLVAAGLLLAALAGAPLARRLGLPGPAAFLAVGIAAGLSGISPLEGVSTLWLEQIAVILLYGILFQGGLETGFAAFKRAARPILLLGLPGTALTAAALALIGHGLLGFSWELAFLVGIALAPTDPAAVYAALRGQRSQRRARTILEGESGFNDPVGISLMVVAVAAVGSEGASWDDGAIRLVQELGIGLVGGLVGAGLLVLGIRATPHLEEGFQALAVLLGAVGVGAATATLHGSGFLAVYVAGLLVADEWARQDGRHHAVPQAFAAASEAVLFAVLGAAFATVATATHVWQGIVLALVLAIVVRPFVATPMLLGSGLHSRQQVLVWWGGLKGAVPLLLAGYPALDAIDGALDVQGIVLAATAASIGVQGATLGWVARWATGRGGPDEIRPLRPQVLSQTAPRGYDQG